MAFCAEPKGVPMGAMKLVMGPMDTPLESMEVGHPSSGRGRKPHRCVFIA
jgi:hypothetical protein